MCPQGTPVNQVAQKVNARLGFKAALQAGPSGPWLFKLRLDELGRWISRTVRRAQDRLRLEFILKLIDRLMKLKEEDLSAIHHLPGYNPWNRNRLFGVMGSLDDRMSELGGMLADEITDREMARAEAIERECFPGK